MNSADAGGTYDVIGFAYPGTPGIALGHSRSLVWTATTAFADAMDTWEVSREGEGVRLGDAVVPITEREEQIIVREEGQPAGQWRTETVVYEDVEGYGVLLPQALLPLPAWVSFPLASHADPSSPETLAARSDYIEGRYRRLPFRRAEIESALASRTEILVWR